jgi:hypothetical protein
VLFDVWPQFFEKAETLARAAVAAGGDGAAAAEQAAAVYARRKEEATAKFLATLDSVSAQLAQQMQAA